MLPGKLRDMNEEKQKPSVWGRLIRGLIAAAFGIVLAVLGLEVAIRVLHLAPPAEPPGNFWQAPNPDYGWYHLPNASGPSYDLFGEYNVPVTMNSKGLRDAEIPYEKPEGVFRIILLGDSFAEGMRTGLAQTAGKVLEASLNEMAGASAIPGATPRFQVINAGVGAWGTDQELLWLRSEGVKYNPDLVLALFFTANDFMNNNETLEVSNVGGVFKPFFTLEDGKLALKYYPFDPEAPEIAQQKAENAEQETETPADPSPARWQPWLHAHSTLYRFLAPRLQEGPPGLANWLIDHGLIQPGRAQTRAALGPNYVPVAYGVYANPRQAEWEEAVALTSAIFGQMDKETQAMGANLAVVAVNSQEQVLPAAWAQILRRYPAMQSRSWDLTQPNRNLKTILDQAAIPYLDLLPTFQSAAKKGQSLYLRRDGHWTAAGERLAGEAIAEFIRTQGLVPLAAD